MARNRRKQSTLPQRVERPMFLGDPDPITLNRMEVMVNNLQTIQRLGSIRDSQADPRRDLDDECGYPKRDFTAEEYYNLIAYEPMAEVVNSIYPLLSWQQGFKLYEDEDADTATEFEDAWDELPSMMGGEPTHHAEEKGSVIQSILLNADILSGVGRHGVILIGLDDGKDFGEPASPRNGQKITYLSSFPEHQCRVTQFDTNQMSPRYGQPVQYAIQFANLSDMASYELNEPNQTVYVHFSRVIHLADMWHTASPSRVFAIPRCRPVRNQILDIRKVRSGSAEIYWKGGLGGHHFGTHPSLGADVDVDADALMAMYEQFQNGLQRGMFTSGMQVDDLSPTTTEPTAYILAQIEAIAMKMRIPKRKLIGNETGERATADDEKSLNDIVSSRNNRYLTSRVVCPLVDRLINLKVLPKPAKGYCVHWPEMHSQGALEKADILLKRTQAWALYHSSGMEATVPPLDYGTRFDSMEEEEVKAMLETAEKEALLYDDELQAKADENGLVPEVEGFKEPSPDPIEVAKAKAQASSGNK